MYCTRAALAIRHNIILRRAVLLERYQIHIKSKRCWQGGHAGVGGALGELLVDGSVGRCGGRQLSWEYEDCFSDENGDYPESALHTSGRCSLIKANTQRKERKQRTSDFLGKLRK